MGCHAHRNYRPGASMFLKCYKTILFCEITVWNVPHDINKFLYSHSHTIKTSFKIKKQTRAVQKQGEARQGDITCRYFFTDESRFLPRRKRRPLTRFSFPALLVETEAGRLVSAEEAELVPFFKGGWLWRSSNPAPSCLRFLVSGCVCRPEHVQWRCWSSWIRASWKTDRAQNHAWGALLTSLSNLVNEHIVIFPSAPLLNILKTIHKQSSYLFRQFITFLIWLIKCKG